MLGLTTLLALCIVEALLLWLQSNEIQVLRTQLKTVQRENEFSEGQKTSFATMGKIAEATERIALIRRALQFESQLDVWKTAKEFALKNDIRMDHAVKHCLDAQKLLEESTKQEVPGAQVQASS